MKQNRYYFRRDRGGWQIPQSGVDYRTYHPIHDDRVTTKPGENSLRYPSYKELGALMHLELLTSREGPNET